MAIGFRFRSFIVIIAFGLYAAVVFVGVALHQRHLLSQIRDADGAVEYRTASLFDCLPGDRVQAITLPESAVADAPDLLTQFRCFRKLERVAIRVITAECPDKQSFIHAPSGPATLKQYYRFVASGRPCCLANPHGVDLRLMKE